MPTTDCTATARREREDRTIARAMRILETRVKYDAKRAQISGPQEARRYLRLRLNDLEREEFWCVFLDAQNKVIDARCLFTGTLTQTSVYPREVVKLALTHNAASIIVAHNHPSGNAEPSSADINLTQALKRAMKLVDVKLLDHFIVGVALEPTSLAARGLV